MEPVHVQITFGQALTLLGMVVAVVGFWLDLRYQVRALRQDLADVKHHQLADRKRIGALERDLIEQH